MENNGIPLVNVPMGPGSQDEGDMVLDYMKMPSEMASYDIPVLPEAEQAADCPQALAVMELLQKALETYRVGDDTAKIMLSSLADKDRALLNQILGEGEVSISIQGKQKLVAQETVLAGVWWIRELNDNDGSLKDEFLEVADVPAMVRTYAFEEARPMRLTEPALPQDVLNAPSVLVEISDASQAYIALKEEGFAGSTPHVINLSLLPFSPQDHLYLSEVTGTGAVTVLSRGYGNCRITSTRVEGLWRVQYYNSTDQLILDTLEITDVPLVACAAQEDLGDSAERLHEIREVMV
jgi:hydrogenase-1 operon protein HyaF